MVDGQAPHGKGINVYLYSYIILYIYIPCKSLQYVVRYVVIPCNSRIIQSSHQQVWHMCVCVIKCLFGSSVPFLSGNSTRGKRHGGCIWMRDAVR